MFKTKAIKTLEYANGWKVLMRLNAPTEDPEKWELKAGCVLDASLLDERGEEIFFDCAAGDDKGAQRRVLKRLAKEIKSRVLRTRTETENEPKFLDWNFPCV